MENGTSTYDKDIEEYKREHHGLTPAQLIRHTVYGEPLPGQSEEENRLMQEFKAQIRAKNARDLDDIKYGRRTASRLHAKGTAAMILGITSVLLCAWACYTFATAGIFAAAIPLTAAFILAKQARTRATLAYYSGRNVRKVTARVLGIISLAAGLCLTIYMVLDLFMLTPVLMQLWESLEFFS